MTRPTAAPATARAPLFRQRRPGAATVRPAVRAWFRRLRRRASLGPPAGPAVRNEPAGQWRSAAPPRPPCGTWRPGRGGSALRGRGRPVDRRPRAAHLPAKARSAARRAAQPAAEWRRGAGRNDPGGSHRLRRRATAAGPHQRPAAGWHDGRALRQIASQVLLGDGVVIRPQSPHGYRAAGPRRQPAVYRELGIATGRDLVERTWARHLTAGCGEAGSRPTCRPGAMSGCHRPQRLIRSPPVRTAAVPARDEGRYCGDESRRAAIRRLPSRPATGAGGRSCGCTGHAEAAPPPDDQLVRASGAPDGWRLDGVFGPRPAPRWTGRHPMSTRGEERWAGQAVLRQRGTGPGDRRLPGHRHRHVTVDGERGRPPTPPGAALPVTGPQVGLGPHDLVATSPPAGSQGNYDTWLPQVVLAQRSLPWQVSLTGRP